jgi:hypothetical protein
MGAQSTSTKEETDTRDSHSTEKERSIGVGVAGQVAGGNVGVHASHGDSKKVSRTSVLEHSRFFCDLRPWYTLLPALSEALYLISEPKQGSRRPNARSGSSGLSWKYPLEMASRERPLINLVSMPSN